MTRATALPAAGGEAGDQKPGPGTESPGRGVIGEGKRADLVLAHRKGNTFILTTSGVRVKGCSDDGKMIWLMGPSGSGKDSLLAELRSGNKPSYW